MTIDEFIYRTSKPCGGIQCSLSKKSEILIIPISNISSKIINVQTMSLKNEDHIRGKWKIFQRRPVNNVSG